MVAAEKSAATNIKSRVNRHAVCESLVAIEQYLKRLRALPPNGAGIFAGGGTVTCIEPSAPLRKSAYFCDARFHIDDLAAANWSGGHPTGVVVLDGNGVLVGIADGTRRRVIKRLSVSLPQKHGRGGQSSVRFQRLAEEARAVYVTKCCELAVSSFMEAGQPIVEGIVVVGSGDLKVRFVAALPIPLRVIVRAVQDVAYGGDLGFALACVLAEQTMVSSRLQQERAAIESLETAIAKDQDLYALGADDVRAALAAGAAETVLVGPAYLTICDDARAAGANVIEITDTTPEGTRFIAGLTGIAALLRWPCALPSMNGLAVTDPEPTANDSEAEIDEFEFI